MREEKTKKEKEKKKGKNSKKETFSQLVLSNND
jgi:hypothetical protein